MKNFISFIYAALMIFALVTAAGYRFYEGEWLTGLIILFVLLWNILIYLNKWEYPFFEK